METRYSKLLCAFIASVACAANHDNSSSTPLYGLERTDFQTELNGVMAFAARSPDDKVDLRPDAVKKMEKAVADLLTQSGEATPMAQSVKQIEDLIQKTMLPKVQKAHDANQKELKRLAGDIGLCKATKSSDERAANVEKVKYERTSPLHKKCRTREAELATEAKECKKSIPSAKQIRDLRCNAMKEHAKLWGSGSTTKHVVEKQGGETPQIYMKRLQDTFCPSLSKFVELETACTKETGTYTILKDGCRKKHKAYKGKMAECDNIQFQMDDAACNRAVLVKDTCESYAECFTSRRLAFLNSKSAVSTAEKDRKAEWRALKRMVCLINSFSDGKVQPDEIKTCKAMSHDTSNLDILYPELELPMLCSVPDRYPATASYKKAEFAPLPVLAKGKVDATECSGLREISTKPSADSPSSCKCERVTLNGPFSPGALVKCTNCLDVYRSTDKDSCPAGTKIFSPRSASDWRTLLKSVAPLRDPHWIADITRSQAGCGGCSSSPMNSNEEEQKSWRTKDSSPWWLRSTTLNSPTQNYGANCYLSLSPRITNENVVTFDEGKGGCSVHSKSYYCQQRMVSTKPKEGSPDGCQCWRVELTGRFSPGALLKCVGCLRVSRSTDKDSCPLGTKIFSPRSREDWKTVLDSAGPLRSPHWIVDVTRPSNGCAGFQCESARLQAAMNFESPAQASWRTSDGSPWWLRSTKFREPSGDYEADCYMDLDSSPRNADTVTFNDHKCAYSSNAYYCQPKEIVRKTKSDNEPEKPLKDKDGGGKANSKETGDGDGGEKSKEDDYDYGDGGGDKEWVDPWAGKHEWQTKKKFGDDSKGQLGLFKDHKGNTSKHDGHEGRHHGRHLLV